MRRKVFRTYPLESPLNRPKSRSQVAMTLTLAALSLAFALRLFQEVILCDNKSHETLLYLVAMADHMSFVATVGNS